MRFPAFFLLSVCFSCTTAVASPSGQADPAFGTGGKSPASFDLHGFNDDLGRHLAADPSGRLYVVGVVEESDPDTCLGIARFLPNGTLDASYGTGGLQCHDLLPGGIELAPMDAAVLPNGRLLVAGIDELSGHPVVCGFNATGDLDITGFGDGSSPGCRRLDTMTVFSSLPSGAPDTLGLVDMAIDTDRIHVATQVIHDTLDVVRVRLARLSFSGNVIPFGQQASVPVIPGDDASEGYWLSELVIDTQGRLLVTGAFGADNDNGSDFYVARLEAGAGTLDPSFNGSGIRTIGFDRGRTNDDVPTSLALLSHGRLLVAGAANTKRGMRPAAMVLDAAGKLLPSFNSGKPAVYDPCVFFFGGCRLFVVGAGVTSEQQLLLAGYATHDDAERIFTLRLNSDGMPDATYGSNFPGQMGFVAVIAALPQRGLSLLMQADRPVLGGWEDTLGAGGRDFLVTRLNP